MLMANNKKNSLISKYRIGMMTGIVTMISLTSMPFCPLLLSSSEDHTLFLKRFGFGYSRLPFHLPLQEKNILDAFFDV